MRRYAAKIDRNQVEIVETLRRAGASVQPLHTVGDGVPDLLIGYRGVNLLLEVKGPRGTLTPDQVEWHGAWRGHVVVVRTIDEALRAAGMIR